MANGKRILISGYYGFQNLGDEAVLSAIVQGLKAESPDVHITVLSASPKDTEETYGVKAVNRAPGAPALRAVRNCDLLISGGGSLIQDATSFRSLAYYLGIVKLAKRFRKKVMILAQGIGPLKRVLSRSISRKVLNSVDLITVRDLQSASLLLDLGIYGPPMVVTADPALLLQPCSQREADRILADVGISRKDSVVAMSLREWQSAPALESAVIDALSELERSIPAKFLLLPLHLPYDLEFARRIRQTSDSDRIVVCEKALTPPQLLGILRRCELMVGMRLHALIFAASVGVPCVGISYDPKVQSFLISAAQDIVSLSEAVSGELPEKIRQSWEARAGLASQLGQTIPPMREAASENISLALELLNRL